ncbi:MAG TPA: GNAT family N-acetyltransferase [Chloroflexota bacterium]|nr:GNAT family N-acetyltransferase [Chloroflexota bacterium]
MSLAVGPAGERSDAVADASPPAAEPRKRQLRMLRPHLDDLPALAIPDGYGLRTFRPGDERAWASIMEASSGIGREWTVEKVRERMIEREQFEPEGLFFVTCDDQSDRPVASATAWRKDAAEQVMGNVHMVCALDDHRGKGLGRLASLAVLHYLRRRGFRAADLSTDDWRVPAIRTYLGLGFVPVYLTDAERVDDHEARWSAIFTQLLTPAPAASGQKPNPGASR